MPTKKSGIFSAIEKGKKIVKNTKSTVSKLLSNAFFLCVSGTSAIVSFIFNKVFLLIPALGILVAINDYNSPVIQFDYTMWCAITLLLIYMEIKIYFKEQRMKKK